MRSLRLLALLLLTLVLGQPALAQPTTDLRGFSFLRLEPSARAAALGGAFTAMYGDDVNAVFYNPALLNASMHGGLSVSYLNHLSDLNAGFAAYSRHLDGIGTVAAGLRYLSYGSFDGRDEAGVETGSFSAGDVALTVGAARSYDERLQYGANLHLVYSSIDAARASAVAADLGVLYHVAERAFTVSASLNNLGLTTSSLGATEDELPLDLRLGVTKRLAYLPLLVSVTGYNLHDLGTLSEDATVADNIFQRIAVGGELQFSEAFNVRVGYNHQRHEALKMKSRLDLAGLGLGVGIRVSGLNVDYAFNSWSSLGGLHQLTVRTRL